MRLTKKAFETFPVLTVDQLQRAGVPQQAIAPIQGEAECYLLALTDREFEQLAPELANSLGLLPRVASPALPLNNQEVENFLEHASRQADARHLIVVGRAKGTAAEVELAVRETLRELNAMPSIVRRAIAGRLELHALVFEMQSGQLSEHDTMLSRFVPRTLAARRLM